jgi:hypothetical protein
VHAARLRERNPANHPLLLERRVHQRLVQHLLGHASIAITLDRCSRWISSIGRDAAGGIDEALGQFTSDKAPDICVGAYSIFVFQSFARK